MADSVRPRLLRSVYVIICDKCSREFQVESVAGPFQCPKCGVLIEVQWSAEYSGGRKER